MAEYIDRDKAFDAVDERIDELKGDKEFNIVKEICISGVKKHIASIPTTNVVEIPEGATNGEMFRAVFGYEPATDSVVCNKEDWCGAGEPCKYCGSNSDSIGREEDWWNAPYKKEVKNEQNNTKTERM